MSDMPRVLHMIRLELRTRSLAALGRDLRLPPRQEDLGYLVHCALGGLFGQEAPRPFALVGRPGARVQVLAYSAASGPELRRHADTFADPSLHSACEWERFSAKTMPRCWEPGRHLGFELRACPVVRMAGEGEHHRKGAEVDVFLARCWASGGPDVPVDRDEVYRHWLAARLAAEGARLLSSGVSSFQRSRLVRRRQGQVRRSALLERPDVLFKGLLEVADGPAFGALLARGVGRHRAFGFGMLLLRPPALGDAGC